MPTASWSVISHGRRIIHDIVHINTYIRVSKSVYMHERRKQANQHAGSKRISFITEGLPWKLQLTIGVYRKKQRERRSRCIKKNGNSVPVRLEPWSCVSPAVCILWNTHHVIVIAALVRTADVAYSLLYTCVYCIHCIHACASSKTRLDKKLFALAGSYVWSMLPSPLHLLDNCLCLKHLWKAHLFGWGCGTCRLFFVFRHRA